jgi:kynurenine formamidase
MEAEQRNWGRWGEEDEIGSLNLITPDVVKAATRSVRTGKVYTLGIPIQSSGVPLFVEYRGTPMRLTLTNESDEENFVWMGAPVGTGTNEDMLVFASHTTSHIDALSHVYYDKLHYNGVPARQMKTKAGAQKLGIEKIRGIVARAVLVDVAGYFNVKWLEPGQQVSGDELAACARSQGVEIRAGDLVLIRTGYLDYWFANNPDVGFSQPGIGIDAARWLAERDIVAVGSDNAAVEAMPFDAGDLFPVHKMLLVDRGIYMMEYLNLTDMANDHCFEGLITVAPLKITGASGSPVNPIVIG